MALPSLLVHSGHPRDHHTPPQFLSLGTLRPQTLGHVGSATTPIPGSFPQEQSEATGSQASALGGAGEWGQGHLWDDLSHLLIPGYLEGTIPGVLPFPGGLLRRGTLLHLEVLLQPWNSDNCSVSSLLRASVSSSTKWVC